MQVSTLTQDAVYLQTEILDINESMYVGGYYSHVTFPSTVLESCESIIIDNHDY
jgi:hypothetical protein